MEPAPATLPFVLEERDRTALGLAAARGLCDPCLGRLLSARGRGLTNARRGETMRRFLGEAGPRDPDACTLCRGLCSKLDFFASLAAAKAEGWEHDTYLVGTRVDDEIAKVEQETWSATGLAGESVRKELNREIGKIYGDRIGKKVEFAAPDIVLLVDTRFDSCEIQVNPLYVYGRYRKLVRDIPQTRWPCQECEGRGCAKCGGTGKLYRTSVEELIGAPLLEATGGEDHRFHGMGREDIDARMLGRGRPFVLEVLRPRRRSVDFGGLERAVDGSAAGRVEVSGLRRSSGDEVEKVKSSRHEKTYQVAVVAEEDLDADALNAALASLMGIGIDQRTPKRVSHRRADLVRRRGVIGATIVSTSARGAVINIRADAGMYIKELVHGDQGRTSPSLAGLLQRALKVVTLDVLEVHDE